MSFCFLMAAGLLISAESATGATASPMVETVAAATSVTIISDSMNRTMAFGWGSAQPGGEYTYGDPGAFSVNGSQGVIKLPSAGQSRTASLNVVAGDQTATVSAGVVSLPTSGNGVSIGLMARSTNGKAYRATVRVQPSGRATLAVARIDGSAGAVSPLGTEVNLSNTVAAGGMITFQLAVSGRTDVDITARAWPRGQAIPAPQITVRDSSAARVSADGTSSIWTYTSGSSQAATVLIDDYSVVVPAPTTPTSTTPTGTAPATPTKTTTASSTPATPTPPKTTPTTSTPPATVTTSTPPTVAPSSSTSPRPTSTAPGTTTTPAPPLDVPAQPAATLGGAKPLGTTNYAAPAGALFVSSTGSDVAAGSQAAPLRTVAKAVSLASSGQTIVLRAGSYHESVVIPAGKKLTIQPLGNEVAWFDGSSRVTSWQSNGSAWRSDNWTAEFDASPTYTRGAGDNTAAGWGFVSPAYPMAAHPDQVWIDNIAQVQVGSLAEVASGMFYVDYAAKALYLGSNPAGHVIRASDLSKAISVRADGSVLRGFGIGRYAPSVPDLGAVTIERPGSVDNMVFADNATTGLSLVSTDVTVNEVTSTRNGLLGVHANYADRLKVNNLLATSNNLEHFNSSPVSGGLKVTRSRDVTVSGSQLRDNLGPGLWMDESVYDVKIVNNVLAGNTGHGLSVELSAKATLIGNLIANNGGFGMKINDTSQVRIWNNTLIDNNRPINIVQDTRRASQQATPGHDPRQTFPDPTMTWVNGPVEVRNNIMSGTVGNCLLCVEDYSKERSAEQMQVTASGDVFRRASASSPQWVVVWSKGAGNPAVFTSLTAFKQGTGQETASLALDGTAATTANGSPTDAVKAAQTATAQPLPADLAALAGQHSGSATLGSSRTL